MQQSMAGVNETEKG